MAGIGIDISEESIKYIELTEGKGGVTISHFGKIAIPAGIIAESTIKESDKLISILKKFRRELGFEFAHISLPEEHAYVFQTDVPEDSTPEQIQTIIEFQMKENVPISPAEAVFDYEMPKVLPAPQGMKKISVAVYPSRVVADYLNVLQGAGIKPLSLEIEGEASARSLTPKGGTETVIIVDIGKTKAGISIVGGGTVLFTATLDIGGDDLTEAIQKDSGISFEEAETLKRERGFLKGKQSVSGALLSAMSVLRDEILRHSEYWREHPMHTDGDKSKKGASIDYITLCGGNANILGIAEYMSASLKMPVGRGNVWTNISFASDYVPQISEKESLEFATAIGLALRSLKSFNA
jgi:type IV pilus assembly protein PilM